MSTFSPSVILEGRSTPSTSAIRLFAGPLTLLLEPDTGFIRQIRLGRTIALNGIYAAVRDRNWETVLPEIRDLRIEQGPGNFNVTFRAVCVNEDVHFIWKGHITGDGHGKITYSFDGEAVVDFLRNRIGFCVLHDASAAGHSCTVEHVDGTTTESRFPELISPQQPFKNLRAITHELSDGVIARVRMSGDTFEMEDQRNWTDASYKTYCTPLELPFPVELTPGDRVEQTVVFEISDFTRPEHDQDSIDTVRLDIIGEQIHTPPRIGFGMASHDEPIEEIAIDRLRALQPDHLRCDLKLFAANWKNDLKQADQLAARLNAKLHLALFIDDDGETQLREFAGEADFGRIDVLLVFHRKEKTTNSRWIRIARELFPRESAFVFTGTDAYFTEINRDHPEPNVADGVSWSLNPQVHAFDNLSLVETLDLQWQTVNSTRHFATGELMISQITLRPRWNPYTTSEPSPVPIDQLPPEVDPRQMSLFGAAWTLGSIASLSRSELLRSITYYETAGWRGLMETSAGPKLAHLFVSRPNMVFPLYFVFALIAGRKFVRRVTTTHPLESVALLCSDDSEFSHARLLVASFVRCESKIRVPANFAPERQLVLDQSNVVNGGRRPEDFLANCWEEFTGEVMNIGPYGFVAVDGQLV